MKSTAILLAATLAASPMLALAASATTQTLATQTTSSGQPITAPAGPLQVTASIVEIGPGGSLPVHKHPFPRYGYILAGRLQVTNLATGKTITYRAGQFAIDPIGQWHSGRALDGKAVRLLIIDQTPPGRSNTILKDPPPASK